MLDHAHGLLDEAVPRPERDRPGSKDRGEVVADAQEFTCGAQRLLLMRCSRGAQGHLHLAGGDGQGCGSFCGRCLAQPDSGRGIDQATVTAREKPSTCLPSAF